METSKKPRITKAHRICYVLSVHGNLTRVEAMRHVHQLEGKHPDAFTPTSNNCYWTSTGGGNGGQCSVVHKGLVRIVPRGGRKFVYANTPEGTALAAEYIGLVARD